MRKILYFLSILAAAAGLASCGQELKTGGSAEEGCAAVRLRLPSRTRADGPDGYPWKEDCDIRIYKKSEPLGKELVRHYFSLEDMPAEIWLLEGDYAISVSLGNLSPASFDRPSHYGEAEFRIDAGQSTDVAVQCDLLDTIVEVVLDDSVKAVFDADLRVTAMVGETFSHDAASEGVNALTYTETRRGYFLLPEDAKAISFCFDGRSSAPVKGQEEMHGHYTKQIEDGKTAGYLYRLTFTWSPDAEAHLGWDFSVIWDPSEDESEEYIPVNPAPRPDIKGDGWDIGTLRMAAGEVRYILTSKASDLKTVIIEGDGRHFEIDLEARSGGDGNDDSDDDGIGIEAENLREVTLVLRKGFFDHFTGGAHDLTLTAVTRNESRSSAVSSLLMPGTFSLEPSDRWMEQGLLKAYLFAEEVSEVKVRYRTAPDGEWNEAEAGPAEEEHVWTATGDGIRANTEYEFQLVADGSPTGAVNTVSTGDGPQIYNAGFETWTTQGKVLCPYTDLNVDQWWDSGNHGSASMIGNITTNASDPRPGSDGVTSARLESKSTLGILAAGNIYLGKFVGTKQTTKGVIRFGHAFDFTWRPKALRFWYKSSVGTVDVLSSGTPEIQRGDQDQQQVYILLCDMPGPHIVDTSNPSTFLNLADGIEEISYYSGDVAAVTVNNCANDATGKVVAWGVWDNDASVDSWTMQTVELHYTRYADIRPCWLMITAAANKYGDYYSGCSKNVLCLDDMELVY